MPTIPSNRGAVGNFLQALVLLHRPKTIVELGTFHGFTATCMGQAVKVNYLTKKYNGHVYTVDFYKDVNAHEVRANLIAHQVEDYVTQISGEAVATSELWDIGTVDLLYIDLTNRELELLAVWEAWHSRLSANGIVVFLEYPHYAIEEFLDMVQHSGWQVIKLDTYIEDIKLVMVKQEVE